MQNQNKQECNFNRQQCYCSKVNYKSNKMLHFIGFQNNTCFVQPTAKNNLWCIQLHVLSGQIKVFKRLSIDLGIITFFNNSNQLVLSSEFYTSIWNLDDSFNWSSSEIIINIRKEFQNEDFNEYENERDSEQFQSINKNDDMLVIYSDKILYSWIQKNNEKFFNEQKDVLSNEWACQLELNDIGNVLIIATYDTWKANKYRIHLLHFDDEIKEWKYSIVIETIQQDYRGIFCFLNDNYVAYIQNEHIYFLEVFHKASKVVTFQEMQLNLKWIYPYRCDIKYLKSKHLLLAFRSDILYLIYSIKQKFYVKQTFEIKYFPIFIKNLTNKEILFINDECFMISFRKFYIQ